MPPFNPLDPGLYVGGTGCETDFDRLGDRFMRFAGLNGSEYISQRCPCIYILNQRRMQSDD